MKQTIANWHTSVEKPFAGWRGPHYFLATFGLVMIVATSLFYAIITSPRLPVTPIQVANYRMDMPDNGVCAGYTYGITYHFKIERPMVIAVYRNIQDEQGRTLFGTEADPLFRVYPIATEVVEHVHWTVPILPSGNYYRVISFISQNQPSVPVMLRVPFRVREQCITPRSEQSGYPDRSATPGVTREPDNTSD